MQRYAAAAEKLQVALKHIETYADGNAEDAEEEAMKHNFCRQKCRENFKVLINFRISCQKNKL